MRRGGPAHERVACVHEAQGGGGGKEAADAGNVTKAMQGAVAEKPESSSARNEDSNLVWHPVKAPVTSLEIGSGQIQGWESTGWAEGGGGGGREAHPDGYSGVLLAGKDVMLVCIKVKLVSCVGRICPQAGDDDLWQQAKQRRGQNGGDAKRENAKFEIERQYQHTQAGPCLGSAPAWEAAQLRFDLLACLKGPPLDDRVIRLSPLLAVTMGGVQVAVPAHNGDARTVVLLAGVVEVRVQPHAELACVGQQDNTKSLPGRRTEGLP